MTKVQPRQVWRIDNRLYTVFATGVRCPIVAHDEILHGIILVGNHAKDIHVQCEEIHADLERRERIFLADDPLDTFHDIAARWSELAKRLVAPGAKASHVSASETHEIADAVLYMIGLIYSFAPAPEKLEGTGDGWQAPS